MRDLIPTLDRINGQTLADAALNYASVGRKVFPLIPDTKLPMVKWGTEATTDPAQIREWWTESPDCNIGSPTQCKLIVDLDFGHGPDAVRSIQMLKADGHEFDPTLTSQTTSKGLQYQYRQPEGTWRNKAGVLRVEGLGLIDTPGIDIRADGGMVVLPPSRVADGVYQWKLEVGVVADAPTWMLPEPRPKPFVPLEPVGADVEGFTRIGRGSMRAIDERLGVLSPGKPSSRNSESYWALTLILKNIREGQAPRWAADQVYESVRSLFPEREGAEARRLWHSARRVVGV